MLLDRKEEWSRLTFLLLTIFAAGLGIYLPPFWGHIPNVVLGTVAIYAGYRFFR